MLSIVNASSTLFPFNHSVATEEEAIAEPHPNVLNLASTIMLSTTSICNLITSPHSGAPTKPVPTFCLDLSKVPVIGHLEGLCHIYVDAKASSEMSRKVVFNAKLRRTSICGAVETLLIHKKVVDTHLLPILNLLHKSGCKIIGDKMVKKHFAKASLAKEIDWKTEYLDSIISVKVVDNIDEAISHIHKYGTNHTESIITSSKQNAQKFLNEVTSSIVMHNTSTQFAETIEVEYVTWLGLRILLK
mgnify:CR=1 FL=1